MRRRVEHLDSILGQCSKLIAKFFSCLDLLTGRHKYYDVSLGQAANFTININPAVALKVWCLPLHL
jgi:hypothetical protein